MTNDDPQNRVARLALRPRDFEQRVRALAADTRNVKWSQHARERMLERDISNRVALRVIREGFVVGDIVPGKRRGEWKGKFVASVRGRREAGVIVLTISDSALLVKTVEWEDIR